MTNPVLLALLEARVTDLIAPPRSWGRAEKIAFLNLPRDLQLFYSEREAQRDQEVRRCQNEAAKARKALAEAQQQLEEARNELAEAKQAAEPTGDKHGAEQTLVS
jgi:hypothetical protein